MPKNKDHPWNSHGKFKPSNKKFGINDFKDFHIETIQIFYNNKRSNLTKFPG